MTPIDLDLDQQLVRTTERLTADFHGVFGPETVERFTQETFESLARPSASDSSRMNLTERPTSEPQIQTLVPGPTAAALSASDPETIASSSSCIEVCGIGTAGMPGVAERTSSARPGSCLRR